MENRQSNNQYVVEPAELGAAVAGLSFGAARHGTARLLPDMAERGDDGSNAAAADAIIRAEEEAAAAEAALATVEVAAAAVEVAATAVEEEAARRAEPAQPAAAEVVDVHASEGSLCSSPEEAASGRGRVRAAVRNLESGVTSETVAVQYGIHDASRGREMAQRRNRRARSASCIEDAGAGRPLDGPVDARRGRPEPSEWRRPVPLQVDPGRVERPGGYGYIPQFCPPPAFPSGVLGSSPAGGGGRNRPRRHRRRDRARDDDRAMRWPRSRSPRR